MDNNAERSLVEQVLKSISDKRAINIVGGDSKSFYGRTPCGNVLDVSKHAGVVNYEPSELVITARAGTHINEIEKLLAENQQMLGFEPAFCNQYSTLGGVIAAGLSGPRTASSGAVRDFILGVKIINGYGQVLRFGGQVMKNVAGFDHSRLMVGSLGTLGVLLEVSMRVMPIPETEMTVSFEHEDANNAIEFFNKLAAKPWPLSASAWLQGQSKIRLSGTENGVVETIKNIGGEQDDNADQFWIDLKNHDLQQFKQTDFIQRVSMPSAAELSTNPAEQVIEWNGGQRWYFDQDDVKQFQSQVELGNASLTQFRGGDRNAEVFSKLDPVSMRLHQNIKNAFDPDRILNPGRMYKDL